MDKRIEFLQKQMLNDLTHQWTIKDLTEASGLSVRHLQKLFKKQSDMPPMSWLKNKRLEKAKELLEKSFLNVSEIGYQVGMRHESHFTRDFRKKYGITPKDYRKQSWDKDSK